jgi:hypothetical protein
MTFHLAFCDCESHHEKSLRSIFGAREWNDTLNAVSALDGAAVWRKTKQASHETYRGRPD